MDHSHQLYLFILSTTLFTDIKPSGDFSHNWFDAQDKCLDHGLTIERDNSDQPYWTGVYRRLTPWINILGCYHDSTEALQYIVKKTMSKSSVGMCQELCYRENGYKFAVKKNECLCIDRDIHRSPSNGLSASVCNFECEDNADNTYSRDCGGESAYNVYETQGVHFYSVETCLSLQCTEKDTEFIPQNCSKPLDKMCDNWLLPDNAYGSNWSLSMEQCRKSQPSRYLLGDFSLSNPHLVCDKIPHRFKVVWVGVARLKYTSIDQGYNIQEEDKETFQDCQICRKKNCFFTSCHNFLNSSIFCQSISNTSQTQVTANIIMSQESFSASTFTSIHSTSEKLFASTSTTGYYDTNPSPSSNNTRQMSSAGDEIALKITLPLISVFIILLLCAMTVVFYSRRRNKAKADGTTKAQVNSGPRKNIDSNVDCVQNNSYFLLEQCPQYISKISNSSNESPYNNSEEGVYDHLRDKISRKPEVEDTYQHASAGVSRDMSEYDTMANAVNKKQEEGASYDYSHQDTYGNYSCDDRAKNHLTDNPYDVAV